MIVHHCVQSRFINYSIGVCGPITRAANYGVPSTTKFMLSNFVVEHAIVIFEHAIMIFKHAIVQIEHAIMIFKHAIVQMKYEIRHGMLILFPILLFNMKPLMGLFEANIYYTTMAFYLKVTLHL